MTIFYYSVNGNTFSDPDQGQNALMLMDSAAKQTERVEDLAQVFISKLTFG